MVKTNIITFLLLSIFLVGCGEKEKKSGTLQIDDIPHARIACAVGSTYDAYLSKKYPDATISRLESSADVYLALRMDKADFLMDSEEVIDYSFGKSGEFTKIEGSGYSEQFAFIFPKGTSALKAPFDELIKELKSSGEIQKIERKWRDSTATAVLNKYLDIPRSGDPINVACVAEKPYFDFMINGEIVGVEAEIMEIFAARLKRPLEYHAMSFPSLIPSIASGKVDIAYSTIAITPERAMQVDFSESYHESRQLLIAKSSRLASNKYSKFSDAGNARIGVLTGSVFDIFVHENYHNASLVDLDKTPDLGLALVSDYCDVALTNHREAKLIMQANPSIGLLEDSIVVFPIGVVFNKKASALRDEYNLFLDTLRESGELEKIVAKWDDSANTAQMQSFEFNPNAPVLRIGTTGTDVPYAFVRSGTLIGTDIELTARFAHSKGYRPQYVLSSFTGLIPLVLTDKVDLIARAIVVTPERAEKVLFSDPYMFAKAQAIALKRNISFYANSEQTENSESKENFFQSVKSGIDNNLIKEHRYLLIIDGFKVTFLISLFAILLGTAFGGVVCSWLMSRRKWLKHLGHIYVEFMHGMPMLVFLMIMYYVVFSSTSLDAIYVAIITFAFSMAASTGSMFQSAIDGVDIGQKEAGVALGFTKFQTFIYITLPQALKKVLPMYKGECISLLKTTSVVGYIAIQDLTKASDIIRSRTFDAFFPLLLVAAIYFLLAWLLGLLLDYINRKTSKI